MFGIMNQYLDVQTFSLTPDSNPEALTFTLTRLLASGNIMDSRLETHCRRLEDRFRIFSSTCPIPEWHPGLIITPEIRCQSEIYLPLAEIQAAFRYLLKRSCLYNPFLAAVPIFSSLSWADALERIHPAPDRFNPARIIAAAAGNQDLRTGFLASLFVPKRYGGGFGRYPLQKLFLQEWLEERSRLKLSVLDAACGSGEGVYEIAAMAAETGFDPASTVVHGCTVEPLELAAAAHGWFPHDFKRESTHRNAIERVSRQGWSGTIEFIREDICRPVENAIRYDVVICNGLLGGPLLRDASTLETAVKGLSRRLKPGGIILAADSFHAGWRRIIPFTGIEHLFEMNGIRIIDLPEGIGGIRTE